MKKVYKLYDSLFFDNKNGNLIEVDSTTLGTNDTTGASINSIYVIPRIKTINSYYTYSTPLKDSDDTEASSIEGTTSSYSSYFYNTQSTNTDNYTVFVFPWDQETYIHIVNDTTKNNVGSFYFDNKKRAESYFYTSSTVDLTSYKSFSLPTKTNIINTTYDPNKTLYAIGDYVRYNISNSDLIIKTSKDDTSKTIDIFSRNDVKVTSDSSNKRNTTDNTVSSTSFAPWIELDTLGQNMVLYMPNQTNTVVALIGYNSDSSMYTINNVCRFTPTTLDNGKNNYGGPTSSPTSSPSPSNTSPVNNEDMLKSISGKDSAMSEYFKWYWYWKSTSGNSNSNSKFNYSDDYLLKTQVVPPVCPACPACNNGKGACTNCGGNGGSGTMSYSGNTMVGGSSIRDMNTPAPTTIIPSKTTIPSTTKSATNNNNPNNNFSAIGNGGFVTNADPNTIGGSLTLATYDTVAGAEGIAQTGAGVLNTASNTVGSVANKALDTVGNVAGDVTGIFKGQSHGTNAFNQNDQSSINNSLYGQDNTQTVGPDGKPIIINRTEGAFKSPYGTSTMDQYSYYGTLPNKGFSNYMPVTADFSAFGK